MCEFVDVYRLVCLYICSYMCIHVCMCIWASMCIYVGGWVYFCVCVNLHIACMCFYCFYNYVAARGQC